MDNKIKNMTTTELLEFTEKIFKKIASHSRELEKKIKNMLIREIRNHYHYELLDEYFENELSSDEIEKYKNEEGEILNYKSNDELDEICKGLDDYY